MKSYDLHIHSAFSAGESSIEQLANTAHDLGYTGFCFSAYYEGENQIKKLQEEIEKIKKEVPIEVYLGFEARDAKEIEKLKLVRKKFDVLLVHGGSVEVNRIAVETPEVDILTHPELGRNDSGLNDVLLRFAAKNKVAIEINFREVLNASKNTRAKILKNISQNVRMAKKLKVPIIICSGALSHFELKDPQVLASFANCIGLDMTNAKNSISKIPENILEESKKRKNESWLMPGVRLVK
jgi:ribonuclease P/MRP protein subunit RPP1